MADIEIKAEITGTVWKIVTTPGAAVAEGDELMILESMKMEIPVIAIDDGTVKEILVKEEASITEGQTLVILEA